MGHKYNKRDGTWHLMYKWADTTTIIRTCPICEYSQPIDARTIGLVDFRACPKCNSKLDIPKKIVN